MKLAFTPIAWKQYTNWQTQDRRTLKRINTLIESWRRTPFEGIGQPEPLKHDLAGWWPRRIDQEHRLVYRVEGISPDQTLVIAQCSGHY